MCIRDRSIATPLKEFVGTGPYKFKERRPDQYVLLTRFDQYSARKEAPSGYGGKKTAIADELRFIPVPNANTRVEGSVSYTHLRAHETRHDLVCRLLLE